MGQNSMQIRGVSGSIFSANQHTTPSRRYLAYMHEAALTYGMPPEIVERYNPDKGVYVPVISELLGAAMHTAVWVFARF